MKHNKSENYGLLDMKKMLFILWLSAITFIGVAQANAMDRQVETALSDISKYEQQFSGQATAQPNAVKRALKLLTLTRQRLDSAPDHSTPAWQEADQRYTALVASLNSLISQDGAAAAAQPKPSVTNGTTQNQKPAASAPAANTQMISQQRVQVKKLKRDIESSTDTMDKAGPKPFQDPLYVEKREERLQSFKTSLSRFANFESDADVVAAAAALSKYENMIGFGKDHAAKELAVLGDVQARLAAVNQEVHKLSLPETPAQPYQEGELGQWLITLAKIRKAAIQIYQPLPEIKNRAYLPETRLTVEQGGAFDMRDVDRFDRALRGTVATIDKSVTDFTANLDYSVKSEMDNLSFYSDMDPSDPLQQSNNFLSKGRADEIRKDLAAKRLLISEAAEYARLLKHENYTERQGQLTRMQEISDLYEQKHAKALELVRMPKAATTDSDLLKIAKETLENPQYEYVGKIERLVINTEKTHRSEDTSEAKIDKIDVGAGGKVTLSGTETTYHYEWDQFQVATVEPEDGKFYIFYSTLKNYSSGDSTTPLNRWIIASRLQDSEIPSENINLP